MLSIKKIKETCLYIHDIEKAVEFYHGMLEFEVVHHLTNKHAFFRVGSSVLLCFNPAESKLKKSPPAHYAKGNQHFAFEVELADYESSKKRIQNKGIEIIDTLVWKSGHESFYFNDMENNVLEIVPVGVWD